MPRLILSISPFHIAEELDDANFKYSQMRNNQQKRLIPLAVAKSHKVYSRQNYSPCVDHICYRSAIRDGVNQ